MIGPDDEGPIQACSERRHPVLLLTVAWCPVDLAFNLSADHTDQWCTHGPSYKTKLGPFDGREDVIASAAHDILRWLGVEDERRQQARE